MRETSLKLLLRAGEEVVREGRYLQPPHGELFWTGDKSLVVTERHYENEGQPRWLVSGDKAYGIVRFEEPRRIDLEEFAELREEHEISAAEREEWWPDAEELWAYQIRDFVPLKEPKMVEVPQGVQTHISEVNFQEPLVKQEDPYMHYPDEDKAWKYVDQTHFRGRSVHIDDRYEQEDYLIGWTLMVQVEEEIEEPVETMEAAREAWQDPANWKLDPETGHAKEREVRGGQVRRADIRCAQKKAEPEEWLEFEGVVEPGEVGATAEFPGVFRIVDDGRIEYGAQKPYAHEYFRTEGGLLPGRVMFRLLEREIEESELERMEKAVEGYEKNWSERLQGWTWGHPEKPDLYLSGRAWRRVKKILPPGEKEEEPRTPFYWLMIDTIDQEPYVLSDGAIEKDWLPPEGKSALPEQIREHVPSNLRYWEMSGEEALEARKELAGMEELAGPGAEWIPTEKAETAPYVLQHHWWRGQRVIRAGPSEEHWDLRIAEDDQLWHLVLESNPLENDEITGVWKPCERHAEVEIGEWAGVGNFEPTGTIEIFDVEETVGLAPDTEANPTKGTPSFIETIDRGEAVVYEEGETFRKYEFPGDGLEGLWTFERESEESRVWLVQRSGGPGTKKSSGILPLKKSKRPRVPIAKYDMEEGIVYGVVLRPDRPDSEGDTFEPEEIRKACIRYMQGDQRLDLQHGEILKESQAKIVECCCSTPEDEVWEWNGRETLVPKGSWWIGVKLFSKELREKVREGEIGYFSPKGKARRIPV